MPMEDHDAMSHAAEKPLFIKIDEYREALSNLDLLKRKIHEVEEYMGKLEAIKSAEDEELKKCRANVEDIKKSLMDVDHRLFEV